MPKKKRSSNSRKSAGNLPKRNAPLKKPPPRTPFRTKPHDEQRQVLYRAITENYRPTQRRSIKARVRKPIPLQKDRTLEKRNPPPSTDGRLLSDNRTCADRSDRRAAIIKSGYGGKNGARDYKPRSKISCKSNLYAYNSRL